MRLLPPLPEWDGMHPLVVHFPVALLIVAPLLLIAGLLWRTNARGMLLAAFVLMLAGTLSTWAAVGSGHATGERHADSAGPVVERVLESHEELGETTRNVFTALTLIFLAILFAPSALRRPLDRLPSLALHGAFLALYAGGLVFLVNTAHQGGRLVHELGVRASISPAQASGGLRLDLREREEGESGAGQGLSNGTPARPDAL